MKGLCSKCGNPNRIGGRWCNQCHNASMRKRRANGLERLSEEAKARRRARWYLHTYVKRGKIKKTPCVMCGNPHVHGHHEDYSKPLDVIWLCAAHHKDKHR